MFVSDLSPPDGEPNSPHHAGPGSRKGVWVSYRVSPFPPVSPSMWPQPIREYHPPTRGLDLSAIDGSQSFLETASQTQTEAHLTKLLGNSKSIRVGNEVGVGSLWSDRTQRMACVGD